MLLFNKQLTILKKILWTSTSNQDAFTTGIGFTFPSEIMTTTKHPDQVYEKNSFEDTEH